MGCNCVDWCGLDFVFMRSVRLFLWFCVGVALSAVTMLSFAGDMHPYNPANDPFVICNADSGQYLVFGQCTRVDSCPSNQDGGSCTVEYRRHYDYIYNGNTLSSGDRQYAGMMLYCPDSAPKWDGTQCIVKDICGDKANKYYNNGPNQSSANLVGGDGAFSGDTTSSHMPDNFCIDGCALSTKNLDGGAVGNSWYGYGNPQFTGTVCTSSVKPPDSTKNVEPKAPNSPEYDCAKAGKGFGYVNGNVMCVPLNKTQENKGNTSSAIKPDGSKTDVKTDSTVKCDGTNCVTTTTTTTIEYNSSGTQTGQSQTTQSTSKPDPASSGSGTKGDSGFCAENPSSPMCQSGTFSGNCGSVPDCTGDAIQCATAKATFETKCALVADKNAVDNGVLALGGGDQETHDATKRTEVNVTMGDPGSSAGSCPGDRSFSVSGQTIVIPFSQLCGGMDLMRIAILAVASFTAAMIILGGVK